MLRTPLIATATLLVVIATTAIMVAKALPLETPERGIGPPPPVESSGEEGRPADRRSPPATVERNAGRREDRSRIRWRDSVAAGLPEAGSLSRGVRVPAEGRAFFTWDPILKRRPNRDWRRWGTDELVRTTLSVLRRLHERFPNAPRIGIGDLSRPHGGDFGPEVSGGIGHATHQNGLDADIYYPRLDRAERAPTSVGQIDRRLSQALVDLFLAAGAGVIYVGPSTGLSGPPEVVQPLVNHDNHLHVRIPG